MKGAVVWFTGLPSSGKTTLARALVEELRSQGRPACLLDGDEIRSALTPSPGYTQAERNDFYATLAGLASLLARQGLIALVAATAHRREYRERARRLTPVFFEVWVRTPLAECERRDAKGIYRRVRAGEIRGVPGVDEPYEEPESAALVVEGGFSAAAVQRLAALLVSGIPARRAR